jgi:hypothetical protein
MRNALAAVMIAVLFASPLYATQNCTTPPSGPQCAGGFCWYNYSPDPSCLDEYNTTSPPSPSCGSYGYGSGTSYIGYTFTIGANDPVTGWFDMQAYVDFYDPYDDPTTEIQGYAYVTHNGVGSFHSLFSWHGDDGDLSCVSMYGGFAATTGDTVNVAIQVYNPNGSASITTSNMFVYTWYHV